MKKILLLLSILIISCNNENIEDEPTIFKKYVKSILNPERTYLLGNLNFEYSNNLLSKTFRDENYTKYSYDNMDKLIKEENNYGSGEQILYTYDSSNRIVKKEIINTSYYIEYYIELTYGQDKVTAKRFYENLNQNKITEIKESLTNSKGRIIETRYISFHSENKYNIETNEIKNEYRKYDYDENGNLTKITSKDDEDLEEKILDIEYDDKVNPYYVAYEIYNTSLYYMENYFSVSPYNWYGTSPNNIIKIGSETIEYEYDEDNYPTKYHRYYSNGLSSGDFYYQYNE